MSLTKNCFTDLGSDQQQFEIYKSLQDLAGFSIPEYDEIDITYYGSTNNIATVVYSNGGSPVATLTLTYAVQPPITNDANLVNVTLS